MGGLLVVSVGAMNSLPSLAVSPLTGVLGDRFDRRKLAMTVQAVAAALALAFAFVAASDAVRPWHAYAYVLISGALLAITQPTQQVLVSNTVPGEAVSNAYAISVLTITGTRIFGPFVGGLLIFWLGYFWNFALESALYLGVVLFLLTVRLPYANTSARAAGPRFSPFADFREGILYLWRQQREILHMMLVSVIPNTILHPVWFLLPLFTVQVLHADADMGGYLLAATGVGRVHIRHHHRVVRSPQMEGILAVGDGGVQFGSDYGVLSLVVAAGRVRVPGADVPVPVSLPHNTGNRSADRRSRPFPGARDERGALRAGIPDRCQRSRRRLGGSHLRLHCDPDAGSAGAGGNCAMRRGVATGTSVDMMYRFVDFASRLVNSAWFEYFIIAVIVLNGILLGLETSDTIDRRYGGWLRMGNEVALWVFIVEAGLKLLAQWPRPWRYFRDGWNIFDFLVIVFALVPATGQFAMIARLARLLRVVRLISAIRDLRLIVAALVRAIPSVGHVIMLMSIVVYIYAIMGYHLFHELDPARWGNLGLSVLTLFNIITLDNWTNVMNTAMRHYPWAWIYFVSFCGGGHVRGDQHVYRHHHQQPGRRQAGTPARDRRGRCPANS